MPLKYSIAKRFIIFILRVGGVQFILKPILPQVAAARLNDTTSSEVGSVHDCRVLIFNFFDFKQKYSVSGVILDNVKVFFVIQTGKQE